MEKLKLFMVVLVGIILGSSFFIPTYAQEMDIIVSPNEVQLEPGGSIKFEVFAYSKIGENRVPEEIQSISWSVEPDSLGSITEDGFFIAGKHIGEVKVKVIAVVKNIEIVKSIIIKIGSPPRPFFKVVVVPRETVVPQGAEQQFEVIVLIPTGERVKPNHVRWEVVPQDLGTINDDGLFTAGVEIGQGKVIALVEIDGLTLRATARVVVSPPPTGAIAGTITNDSNDLPIQDAHVKAVRLGKIHWVKCDTSDTQGNFLLGDLIPGIYVLYANAKGFIGEFYDDTRNFLEATPLIVAENDTLTDKNFALSEGGKITGTVFTDLDSLPLADAHVVASLVVNPRFARHALTDNDGSYEIESLPPGDYAVRANAPGYKEEYYDDAEQLIDAEFLRIDSTETKDNINFGLATASAIRGVVTNVVDGSPIARARIRVFLSNVLISHLFHRETRTNENGEYIVQIRPGRYIVHASAEGFNGEFYDDVRERFLATPVEVFPDSHTTGIDFDLVPRGSISGTVSDQSTGSSIVGAVVEAFKENITLDVASNVTGFRSKTDSLGHYIIENVPSGKYLVRAIAEGYLPEFFKEAATKKEATLVTVLDSTEVDSIDFTLEKGGSISGLVASQMDSMPIPRALVRVWEANTGFHRRAYTRDDGTYKVEGLRTGYYYVHVIAERFFPEFYDNVRLRENATLVEVIAPDDTPDKDFYLEPFIAKRGTIAGRVFSDEDGSSILGAVVIAVERRELIPHITFTGSRGFYKLTDLKPGKYFVFAWAEGFIGEYYDNARNFSEADPVFVHSGQVKVGINFGLAPKVHRGVYAISGKVHSAETNTPIEGILVQARFENDIAVNAVTDADGNYVLADLPAGAYKIEATGVGFANGYFGGTNAENAVPVSVGNGEDAANVNFNLDVDNVTSIGSENNPTSVPEKFALFQNYPNPFNPETSIKYHLAEASQVTLKIFNILGQEIRTLLDKLQEPGVYTIKWDGKDNFGRQVASGIYLFQIKAGDKFRKSQRMLLLK
ncbi:MAG: carboxypeptidase regulatory-like domain-containing protein [bacterium]